MKKITFFIVTLLLFSNNALAKTNDGFFLRTFATIEYSAPSIGGGAHNSRFRTNDLGEQLINFENIAIGAHFRVNKFLGFNLNWAQSELSNNKLAAAPNLRRKAHFDIEHYNITALFYAPKVANSLEFFAELGVSDMKSKINYITSSNSLVSRKSHATAIIYGAGFQFLPFEKSQDAIRFSMQKYSPVLGLLDANYTTFRIGYLKAF